MLRFDTRFMLSLFVLLGLLLGGCEDKTASPAAGPDPVPAARSGESEALVMVEGEAITVAELDRKLDQLVLTQAANVQGTTVPTDVIRADMRSQALSQLIDRKVQLLEARKRGVTVPDSELEGRLGKLKSIYASPEEFDKMVVERFGFTTQSFRESLRDDLMLEELQKQWRADHPVQVTEAEMLDLYQTLKDRGQLDKEGRTLTYDEFKAQLGDTAKEFKAKKEYENWVSELRSSAQVVEMGAADLP